MLWIRLELPNWKVRKKVCKQNNPTDDEMLAMARQDRPISREELGMQTASTNDGLQSLQEGFDFLQFNDQSDGSYMGSDAE